MDLVGGDRQVLSRPDPRVDDLSKLKRTGFSRDLISWEDGVYGTSKSVFAGGA